MVSSRAGTASAQSTHFVTGLCPRSTTEGSTWLRVPRKTGASGLCSPCRVRCPAVSWTLRLPLPGGRSHPTWQCACEITAVPGSQALVLRKRVSCGTFQRLRSTRLGRGHGPGRLRQSRGWAAGSTAGALAQSSWCESGPPFPHPVSFWLTVKASH